ncbi:LUNAPARK2.1, LUNAPARK2, LUNAPARK2.2, LUNAPARK A [Hibiscus trionum]|uniref:LUNAPARK2.1, LUNAPARK2, LUNAPARK2.2, LUNAPARK A n=1 Tax=Hibiscus trionum TaxID=183268 RepID=A0A9W7HYS4_HIBTR|nr:LUNAPARK2.1, LUNAPARK2, LUNAPARK2.2, LUNAPARK A [Hibiscus trionum]
MAEDKGISDGEKSKESSPPPPVVKKPKGVLSRVWSAIFRTGGDNFEKRLEHITKEETAVVSRMKRRSQTWRGTIRRLIVFSVVLEVIAIAYAIMTTRSVDLDWKMRAFRILPMFLLPAFSSIAYSALASIIKMRDERDKKTLERLRAERQAKINELKEKTNYYITQQLIQRYDPDPAAKAAAATVLASKLGADSGLKFYVEDESKLNVPGGKSNDVEVVPSGGLRQRKHSRPNSMACTPLVHSDDETTPHFSSENDGPRASEQGQVVVNHYHPQGPSAMDGGWLARFAALLVGEDPTQSYALICGNCRMHNGLARKEDFPYITYYCPHCHALNKPKESVEQVYRSSSLPINPLKPEGAGDAVENSSGSMDGGALMSNNPVKSSSEIEEVTEKLLPSDPVG